MEELTACRICLVTDAKLVKFCQYQLIRTYELLSGTQYQPADYLPHHICSICHRMLRKCAVFQHKCCTSYSLLNQAIKEHPITAAYIKSVDRKLHNLNHPYGFTSLNLTVYKDNSPSLYIKKSMTVKEEDLPEFNVNLMQECNSIEIDESLIKNENDYGNDLNSYDLFNDPKDDANNFSSDEEPLSNILKKKKTIQCENKRNQKKTIKETSLRNNKRIYKCSKIIMHSKQTLKNRTIADVLNENIACKANEETEVTDIPDIESKNDVDNILEDDLEILENENDPNNFKLLKKSDKKERAYNTQDIIFLMDNHIDIVYLSKEQQKEQIECRKMSNNYVMSQFKCHLCHKGYMTDATFENHMRIHDPSRGSHTCDICQSTFSSARNLASHIANSHSRNFVCKKCNAVFKSCHKTKEHIKWHEGVTFDCRLCGASFRKRTTYMTHIRIRHQSGVTCELCGDCFTGAYGLNMHVKKSHRGHEVSKSSFSCENCSMRFSNREALEKHKSLANGDICDSKVLHCHMCGENFESYISLGQHLDSHKVTKRYHCTQCTKSYSSVGAYSMHCRSRHGVGTAGPCRANVRAFVCEHCGTKCSNKYVLRNHIRSHTGEKPYQCKLCPKRFSLPQRLQIHVRTHTGDRPFQCAACPKAFTHKAGLNRHSAVHTGAKPYTCTHCQKSFSQSNSLKIHIRTVHLKQPAPYRRNNRTKEQT